MSTSFATIRALPGLHGGGFARVLDVQTLAGGRLTGSGGPLDALVRMEKLQDPLRSFSQNLKDFSTDSSVRSSPTPKISSDVLTLLQQVQNDRLKLPGDQPSFAQSLDNQLAQRQQARAEHEKEQQAKTGQDTAAGSKTSDTTDFVDALQQKNNPLGRLGPDIVKQLDALLSKKVPLDIPGLAITANELTAGSIRATSPAYAAQAAKAYASQLAEANA